MIKNNLFRAIVCITLFAFFMGVRAQKADMRLGQLLNGGDWFALKSEYPVLKDSVRTPILRLMSEAMLGYYFNRPDQAVASVDSLLQNHQAELGLGNITSMLILKSAVEFNRGNYAASADMLKSFESQLKAQNVAMDYAQIDASVGLYQLFRSCRPMTTERPKGDVTIPMTNEPVVLKIPNDTVPRGTVMRVPVEIGGKTYRPIFDTGVGMTFMSANFAKKVGVRVLGDSMKIIGGSTVKGQAGVLDSMSIGGIVVRNVPVAINSDTTLNRVADIDFVLGLDVMMLFDEVQIFPHDGNIVVPARPTACPSTGSNMYVANRQLNIKGASGGKDCVFFFDTGNGQASLSASFYKANKPEIDAVAKNVRRLSGGVGAVENKDMLLLPSWTLRFGGHAVVFKNLPVQLEYSRIVSGSGNIGMALVNQFHKVTLNFKDCFVAFE